MLLSRTRFTFALANATGPTSAAENQTFSNRSFGPTADSCAATFLPTRQRERHDHSEAGNVCRMYNSSPVGEPNCGCAGYPSVLHRVFQFGASCEGLRSLDGGKLVSDCDVIRIVGRLVHSLSCYALGLLYGADSS